MSAAVLREVTVVCSAQRFRVMTTRSRQNPLSATTPAPSCPGEPLANMPHLCSGLALASYGEQNFSALSRIFLTRTTDILVFCRPRAACIPMAVVTNMIYPTCNQKMSKLSQRFT